MSLADSTKNNDEQSVNNSTSRVAAILFSDCHVTNQ